MAPSTPKNDKLTTPRISAKDAVFATILVGEDRMKFTVHEELLVHHSPFFRGALQGRFKEAQKKEIVLADTKPDIFEYFIHWLYYGRFPRNGDDKELLEAWAGHEYRASEYMKTGNLIHIYIFCDKYDVRELKRTAMDELFDNIFDDKLEPVLPGPELVKAAFENVPETSSLCRFLVDANCYWADDDEWAEDTVSDFPCKFIVRVLQTYREYVFGIRIREDDVPEKCDYHEHTNDEERKACKSEE
ncbi:hypothetical protein NX059_009099 [Plenodomus lindquistii]|nr:hypothetical protein NX059_009099 [Plenodomus lindquistii]